MILQYIFISLIIVLTTATTQLSAKTVHVDPQTGSDSNGNGDVASPYASWDKARQSLVSGDTMILHTGYYGSITEGLGPTDVFTEWTYIKAAPGDSPIFESIAFGANGGQYFGNAFEGSSQRPQEYRIVIHMR